MRAFFDSNVIVYALASDDPARRATAQRLLALHGSERSLVLSTQVLLETYNVLTRKKRAPAAVALAAVRLLARHEVIAPSGGAALLALELAARDGLSIWDALIVQAALEARCDTLYSEALQAGRLFGTLEVVNPFDVRAHEQAPAYAPGKVSKVSKGSKAGNTRRA